MATKRVLYITRQGSPIEIEIPVQDIAANLLDNICDAPDLDAVKLKRTDGDLDETLGDIIAKHIQDAILDAHKLVPTDKKPSFTVKNIEC